MFRIEVSLSGYLISRGVHRHGALRHTRGIWYKLLTLAAFFLVLEARRHGDGRIPRTRWLQWLAVASVGLAAEPWRDRVKPTELPTWFHSPSRKTERAAMERALGSLAGKHLVVVRYPPFRLREYPGGNHGSSR